MDLKKGQVLWLRLPFGKTDETSSIFHPYLIIDITRQGAEVLLVGQMDSDNDKPWEIIRGMKIPIDNDNPQETVIYKTSYLQTDRKIRIEVFEELMSYMDTEDTLTEGKLRKTVNSYFDKRQKYGSDSFRDMYFTREEILELNPREEWVKAQQERFRKYNCGDSTVKP